MLTKLILFIFAFLSFYHETFGQLGQSNATKVGNTLVIAANSYFGSYIYQFSILSNSSSLDLVNATDLRSEDGSHVTAVFADKRKQRVLFVDQRKFSNDKSFLGIHSYSTNSETYQLQGMMWAAFDIAYDWISGNVYWADSSKSAILVTDSSFKYFKVILDHFQPRTYMQLAISPPNRLLFFLAVEETSLNLKFFIKVCNLAGKNVEGIYETENEIRSFYFDETDNRLYWSENVVFENFFSEVRSRVMSSSVDGSDVKQHTVVDGAHVAEVAAFGNTIYLAELQEHYDPNRASGYHYVLRYVSKDGSASQNLTFDFEILGLSIYSLEAEDVPDQDMENGSCARSPPCDHICLPTSTTRVCGCSQGYTKSSDTGCVSKDFVDDDYILLADVSQKRFFQFSLKSQGRNFTALPIETLPEVTALAMNVLTRQFYWADRKKPAIYTSNSDGSNVTMLVYGRNENVFYENKALTVITHKIYENCLNFSDLTAKQSSPSLQKLLKMIQPFIKVSSLDVDSLTGNVYFVDDNLQTINAMNGAGRYIKTLATSSVSRTIVTITLDIANKFVYWLDDIGPAFRNARLWRMSFDGSNRQLVHGTLLGSTALTIDLKRASLLINNPVTQFKIGEIPLDIIDSNSTVSRESSFYNKYSTYSSQRALQFHVVDGSNLYFTTIANGLQKIHLDEAASKYVVGEPVGSNFYQPQFFSVYQSSFKKYIETLPSPCSNHTRSCSQLCLDRSPTVFACFCQNGVNVTSDGQCGEILTPASTANILSTGAIVGIAISILVISAILVFFIVRNYYLKKKTTSSNRSCENRLHTLNEKDKRNGINNYQKF